MDNYYIIEVKPNGGVFIQTFPYNEWKKVYPIILDLKAQNARFTVIKGLIVGDDQIWLDDEYTGEPVNKKVPKKIKSCEACDGRGYIEHYDNKSRRKK